VSTGTRALLSSSSTPVNRWRRTDETLAHVQYVMHVTYVWHVKCVVQWAMATSRDSKQNVTISLSRQTVRKVKVLAARRATSISGLLAEQIELLVGEEEAYERAERQATTLLDQGFHLGGVIRSSRDDWHER